MDLTLETLPKAFMLLTNEVSEIKKLLLKKSNEQPTETVRWFDLSELCHYHSYKPSKPTVYGCVNAGVFPYTKVVSQVCLRVNMFDHVKLLLTEE